MRELRVQLPIDQVCGEGAPILNLIAPSSRGNEAVSVDTPGYSRGGDTVTGDYEEDHLISLELGGSPTSPLNLWPEPYSSPDGARVKDQLENKLRALVCAGTIQLATAQSAIATNWWIAYETYIVG